jgi:hypothetical protein
MSFVQGVDDWEEFFVKDATAGDTKVEKHYVLVITLSGYGVLGHGILRSGSKCMKQPQDMRYWFDRLVELGIGTKEEEDMLRAMVWNVRHLLLPLHACSYA